MTDIPIIFSAPMITALLREVREPGIGKTMTRRLLYSDRVAKSGIVPASATVHDRHRPPVCEFGHYWTLTGWHKVKAGDRLFVRESFSGPWALRGERPSEWFKHGMVPPIWYWADGEPEDGDWTKPKPSIHCPRWASRLTLICTANKIERLQDISEADAKAEGAPLAVAGHDVIGRIRTHRTGFVRLWGSLHGTESWLNNPWVVAVSFRPILANIDAPEAKAA